MTRADITRLNAQISTGPHPRRQTEIFFKRPPPPIRKEPAPTSSKSTNKTKQRGNRPWLRFYRFAETTSAPEPSGVRMSVRLTDTHEKQVLWRGL